MIVEDRIRLLLFAAAFLAVYGLAIWIVAGWARRRLRRLPPPARTPAGRWTRRSVLSLAGAGVGGAAWGRFVEPYWVETTHVPIESPHLGDRSNPVRLVHISDLHCDAVARAEDRLPDLIAQCHPDLVVFTGDCVNGFEGRANFRRCMQRIAAVAPTFAVTGNWDHAFILTDPYAGTGVQVLHNRWVSPKVRGLTIHVGGLAYGQVGHLDETLAAGPREGFRLFLYHSPDLIYRVARAGMDLYCAGHTHGGQVALPWFGAIITLSEFGKRFEHGLYRVENTHLYVNRGIGMEGGPVPRVRLFARPEVTCIELSGKSPS